MLEVAQDLYLFLKCRKKLWLLPLLLIVLLCSLILVASQSYMAPFIYVLF